jgi:hypothetical protein
MGPNTREMPCFLEPNAFERFCNRTHWKSSGLARDRDFVVIGGKKW